MKRSELKQKLALLETENDHLMTEVDYVDRLMRLLGFARGLESIKVAAQEIINRGIKPSDVISRGEEEEKSDQDLV